MRIAVIGAGPAGLTAAHRLQLAGHEVHVLEAADTVGGRTHTHHFGPGHWTDDGAGWLGSFYPDTLALFDDLGLRSLLRVLQIRGGGDLLVRGELHPNPNSVPRILSTGLLSSAGKARFLAWMARLFLSQPGDLRVDERFDSMPAMVAVRGAGRGGAERIIRPSFEGPFFSRLEELSGALVRSWLRALSVGTFFQVEGGMDAPWRAIAGGLPVRTGVEVERVTPVDGHVEVAARGLLERFDGAVVAVPAPIACIIVDPGALPEVLRSVVYAPHVRLYAARRGPALARSGIHAFPSETVATVELGSGEHGSWGRTPDGWQWQLFCAPAASSERLLDLPDDELASQLWAAAASIDARIFPLADAEIVHIVRWRHAVPRVGPGHFASVRRMVQRQPVVFAGDWLVQPCVEGAVRSGIAAAEHFS
jgi:oxygen-dependent protoporphyrinogen oxidase